MRLSTTTALLATAALLPATAAAGITMNASAYSPDDAGPRAASGLPFTWQSAYVAHRTLPFGTRLAVSYRGRTSITTVQDRGPYIAGRDLDLAPGVWRWLGRGITSPLSWGHRLVDVQVLGDPIRPAVTRRQTGTGSGPQPAVPSTTQAAASVRARARVLVGRYGYPWPVFDRDITGRVATLVMARERGQRTTCAPFGQSTVTMACRTTSSNGRRVTTTRIRVEANGGTTVLRRAVLRG
jgi:3D (Asp-Asp-Asp) domain-containing protein